MRASMISLAIVLALGSPAWAQDSVIAIRPGQDRQLGVRRLPADVALEAIRRYNAPGTLRLSGATRIPAGGSVEGDVSVIGGPVSLGGRIGGDLMVLNGDLVFEAGAVVDGDVLVVGGTVRGGSEARIAGTLRVHREALYSRRVADTLEYAPQRTLVFQRRQRAWGDPSDADFVVALGGTFNRVEGVPWVLGPKLDLRVREGARFQGDARLILRTAENLSLTTGRFGYRMRAEMVAGSRTRNLGVGLRAYDQVTSTEPWPLKNFEAGWAAFLLHDDYRDWYRRRGWGAYSTLRASPQLTVSIEGREERHFSIAANDPWTVFDNASAWRENPAISDGVYRTLAGGLRYDTRNDRSTPSSGMLVSADIEATRGAGVSAVIPGTACITTPCGPPSLDDGTLSFSRLFLDARSYVRLTPAARLHLRLAGGGKLGGEDLPAQYRMSLGFPDPLPGYGFRQFSCGGQAYPGHRALCDRAIVAQVEFRTHLGFDVGPGWANDWGDPDEGDERWKPFRISGPDIVVFADAGRSWNTGNAPGEIPSDRFPTLSSFNTDVGIGLDLGPAGVYLAKSVGALDRSATFSVRLGRRF